MVLLTPTTTVTVAGAKFRLLVWTPTPAGIRMVTVEALWALEVVDVVDPPELVLVVLALEVVICSDEEVVVVVLLVVVLALEVVVGVDVVVCNDDVVAVVDDVVLEFEGAKIR